MKPWPVRIGVYACVSEGYHHTMQFPELLRQDEERVLSAIGTIGEVVYPGLVMYMNDIDKAIRFFTEQKPDIIVAVHLCYTRDEYVVPLVRALPKTPVLIYLNQGFRGIPEDLDIRDYSRTWQSNSVVQIMATLKRFWPHRTFPLVVGHGCDEASIAEISDWARGAALLRSLEGEKAALLPDYCQGMFDTWPDPALLENTFGTHIISIRDSVIHKAFLEVTPAETEALLKELLSKWEVNEDEVTMDAIRTEVQRAVAFRQVIKETGVTAIGDMHLGGNIGESLAMDEGIQVAAEGDVASALINLVLGRAAGKPVMCFEHLGYDIERDLILGGHNSFGPTGLAASGEPIRLGNSKFGRYNEKEQWIAPQVALQFPVAPGPVTLVTMGVQVPGKLVIRVVEGEVISHKRLDLHYPYALVKLNNPGVQRYFKELAAAGGGHHFGLSHGHFAGVIKAFGALAGVEVVEC